ncbi:MAG: GNAT family N-acetyltransferase [Rhodospirillaceae bacterium]|nr:GNAT family N-acetyltransferase [Rhodospirillaceae bacterium]
MSQMNSTITYLEMTAPPNQPPPPPPAHQHAIMRAEKPTVSFYRFLYNTIGQAWLWWERRELDDDALKTIIEDARIEIYVLYMGGVPAGYVELDCRIEGEIEVAYFGLMEEFIGLGLGRYLLDWAVHQAWSHDDLNRVWLHSCTEDHPSAIALYQRAGFVPFDQQTVTFDDPSDLMKSS